MEVDVISAPVIERRRVTVIAATEPGFEQKQDSESRNEQLEHHDEDQTRSIVRWVVQLEDPVRISLLRRKPAQY
jgi:hypothetical protein